MGREYFATVVFDDHHIAFIFLQMIEIARMPARPVKKETEYLLKDIPDRLSFQAFAHLPKTSLRQRINADSGQIFHEQGQSATLRQIISCRFHLIYFCTRFILSHILIPLLIGWRDRQSASVKGQWLFVSLPFFALADPLSEKRRILKKLIQNYNKNA